MSRILAVALLLCAGALASTTFYAFSASIVISDDPDISGALVGTIVYQYDPSGKGSYRKMKFTLPDSSNTTTAVFTEIVNYTEGTKFLSCPSTCTAEMWSYDIDQLFPLSGESAGGTYSRTASSDEVINGITFDSSGVVSTATYSSGKKVTFTNVVTSSSAYADSVFDYSSWGCPERSCNIILDLILVLDDSGSIDTASWKSLKSFAIAVGQSFSLSEDATNLGVVLFSTDAEEVFDLTYDTDLVNESLNNLTHQGGYTCIGCGLGVAIDMLNRRTATRLALDPKVVVITVTDGGNNRAPTGYDASTYLTDNIAELKSIDNMLSVVVAVKGSDYKKGVTWINKMATNSSYIFTVSGYTALMTILDSLITATCEDYPSSACGTTCEGFCACGECRCPNSCPNDDKCVTSSCSTKSGVTGCHSTAIAYDDSNACTVDACDSTTGISHTTLDCSSSDLCTLGLCDTTTGCYTEPVDCTGNTTCSNYHCDSTTGSCVADANSCCGDDATHCSNTTSKCNITSCVMSGGEPTCAGTTQRCSDTNNYCTIDSCNTSATSSSTACVHTTNTCDDSDPCTVDSCSGSSCVHTDLCDDGLRCTADYCSASSDLKNATCKHVLIDCSDYNYTVGSGSNWTCKEYTCTESGTDLCILETIVSNGTCAKCRNSTSTSRCSSSLSSAATGAIIGAAAVAGIVVACVAGFMIFSTASAFGTYKLVQMNRAGANMGAHTNPMYKPSDAEAVNPAYAT
eukprot:m51a1_g1628 hypothetical protein (742) ;mRNA; f:261414-264100